MKFSEVKAMRIPKTVRKIRHDGKVLWTQIVARYVSLGDSIAAGHAINEDWAINYGEASQYGKNGRTSPTVIVPDTYTDLIRREFVSNYGEDHVTAVSFAHSGDTVADLMNKLDHAVVRDALAKASIVTVCIGANDVLKPALMNIEQYIDTGDLTNIEAYIAANMVVLNDDSAATSYISLFNKLAAINPNAKYVFTTIYNPYKYLWIEEGRNGFFGPLVNYIDWTVNVPFINYELDMGAYIQERILQTSAFQLVYSRVNGLGDWTELRVNRLNEILRNKINAYQATNTNFFVAETKALFDPYPDKTDSTTDVDYSDLVNVEFTRTYNTAKMDWGALWRGSNAATFWSELGAKHLYWINAFPSTNPMDYVDFHMEEYAADLVQQVIDKVILPNVDPHPEFHGHQVLKNSFVNALNQIN